MRLHRSRPCRSRRRRGFTLMEVLLVLVILVILGSLAVGAFTTIQGNANKNAVRAQIALFKGPLDHYHLSLNQFPTTQQGLEALLAAPAELENPAKWEGPYLDVPTLPLDPWGNPYQYAAPGTHNPTRFDIWSLGPDGADGTADDIGNWVEAAP
jgi:general secretion pathway protein G